MTSDDGTSNDNGRDQHNHREQDDEETPTEEEISAEEILWQPPESSEADLEPHTDWWVFGTTAVLAFAFLTWGVFWPQHLQDVATAALDGLVRYGGWLLILIVSGFVVFALWLAFSRYGTINLGEDGEKPEFRTVSWFAMMFGAGMGIGLVFFGASEPVEHFVNPPPGAEGENGGQDQQIQDAMATTLFHWVLHPWAIYSLVGLAIAYGTFRRGRSQLISSAFIPLIGERNANGLPGRVIDVFALFATLFGTAASLGLGTFQIAGGFEQLGWVDSINPQLLITIIVLLMIGFVTSAASGIAKGIQWLSNINLVMAFLLIIFLLAVGSALFVFDLIPNAVGNYFSQLFTMSSRTAAVGGPETTEWLSEWTIFYWAWWISWSPFVGMFIARISRGRTLREFITGVILVPGTASLLWFCVLGGLALNAEIEAPGSIFGAGAEEARLFALLQQFPVPVVLSVLVMVLIAIFFITGTDSASVIMGTMSQNGSINPKRRATVFWGVMVAGITAIIMLAGGEDAVDGLRNFTILAASPFALIVVLMCVAMLRDFRHDPVVVHAAKGEELLKSAVVSGAEEYGSSFELDVSAADSEDTDSADGGSGGRTGEQGRGEQSAQE